MTENNNEAGSKHKETIMRRKLIGEWISDLERITKKMREDYEKGVFGNIRTEAMMIIKKAVHLRDEVAGLMAIESILEKLENDRRTQTGMICGKCGSKMRIKSISIKTWAGGEYDEEEWICDNCGRIIRISPFGDIILKEGEVMKNDRKQ